MNTEQTSERKALALAIAKASDIEARATKAREALERGEQFLRKTKVANVIAEEALQRATTEHGDSLASALASGKATGASGIVRAARQKLVDAEDELKAALAAREKLKLESDELEGDMARAKEAVTVAAQEVIGLSVDSLIAEVRDLQSKIGEKRAVLWEIKRGLHVWSDPNKALRSFFNENPFPNDGAFNFASPLVSEWRDALVELTRNADAVLPTFSTPSKRLIAA